MTSTQPLLHGDDRVGLLVGIEKGLPVDLDEERVDRPTEREWRRDLVGHRKAVAVAARDAGPGHREPPGGEEFDGPLGDDLAVGQESRPPPMLAHLGVLERQRVGAGVEAHLTAQVIGLRRRAIVDVVHGAVRHVEAPATEQRAL